MLFASGSDRLIGWVGGWVDWCVGGLVRGGGHDPPAVQRSFKKHFVMTDSVFAYGGHPVSHTRRMSDEPRVTTRAV